MGIYFIFAAIVVIAIFGLIMTYIDEHPKKSAS
jgi:hypothetical protein